LTAALAVSLAGAAPVFADQPKHFLTMPDRFVRATVRLARENLATAKLPDGSLVGEESAEEKARPLLPFEDARDIVNAGAASGFAAWCGVEWEVRSFQPLMHHHHETNGRSDKAMAFIGLLHGIAQGIVQRDIARAGACTAEDKAAIDSYLNLAAGAK
jgi:hypothetical protein